MQLSPYKKRKCQKCHSKCNYHGLVNVWGLGFFVCLFSSLTSSIQLSHLLLQRKVYVLKKSWVRRSHKKRWSDNKAEVKWHQTLLVSHAHAHTESHLLGPDNSFARGTTNGSFLSIQNQLQHTCLSLSNSLLLFHELQWPQAAGDRDTCNSSHPLAQIPPPLFFFVRLQTLPRTLIHYCRAALSIRPTHAWSSFSVPFSNDPVQEDKTFTGRPGFQWINL